MNKEQKLILARILITAVMLAVLHFLPVTGLPRLALYLAAYLLIGFDIVAEAVKGISEGEVFDENFLMTVATVGAFVLGTLNHSGNYTEGVAVMLFYRIGELFEDSAVDRSRDNITRLMDLRPDHANVEKDGALVSVPPDQVPAGSVIVVQPGERIPLDGIITDGTGSLNTAPLTGESLPRDVSTGDEVFSGCISLNGVLRIRTSKEFGESTASRILELVENAAGRKAAAENFITRFAKVYTPVVCIAAAALAVLPPVFLLLTGRDAAWTAWLYRALTFLVVSCPCALVISIPLTFFAGIGGAGKEGILIKGSNYLEALSQTKVVAFDKTGTLTRGVFEVTAVYPAGMNKACLIEYAALAECASSHPISRSLRDAYGKEIDRSRVKEIREISGHGVTARVDGREIAVGNEKLMKELKIDCPAHTGIGTAVYAAADGVFAGLIEISDVLRESAGDAVRRLKSAGVKKTVLLTGDTESAARQITQGLEIDGIYAGLLPEDKVNCMERILAEKENGSTAVFVGDGINDAPVLTRADIGIAMGAMGSDAAIEAADVVLMDDDPMKVAKAIAIARRCMGIVRQNILFALAVKLACLVLCSVGIVGMWAAVFADVGVMVIAVLNAVRAMNTRRL